MGGSTKIGVAVVAVVGVCLAAWLRLERMQASRPRVWTERVAQHDVVEMVVGHGTVVGAPSVIVSADTDGRVSSVTARVGQRVSAGDPLVLLDPTPFALKVERARAVVAAKEADKQRAVFATEQARGRAELAERQSARAVRLFALGVESVQAVAEAHHRARVSEWEVMAQRHRVAVAAAEALAADAELADALKEADRSVVRAPTDGEIVEVRVGPRRWVYPGSPGVPPTPLVAISRRAAPDVEVFVEQRQAVRVRLGQSASLMLEAISPRPFPLRVVSVRNVRAGTVAGAVPIRLRLEGQPAGVRNGIEGTVRIALGGRSNVVAIPNQAIRSARRRQDARRTNPGGRSSRTEAAWVVRGGLVKERMLVTGLRGDSHTEVLAGLSLGESVITGPYAVVRSIGVGDAVIPVRAPIVSQ